MFHGFCGLGGGPGENRTHKYAVQRRQFPISLPARGVCGLISVNRSGKIVHD